MTLCVTLASNTIPNSFIEELLENGVAVVGPYAAETTLHLEEPTRAALADWEVASRAGLGGEAPAYDAIAGEWALCQFYRFAQLLICRDIPPEAISATVAAEYPGEMTAAVIYSADLLLQFVPGIYRRANETAPADSLIATLKTWAMRWPLSSVGIPLDRLPVLGPIAETPALWRLYADRVAAAQAADRWADPAVALQLRADLGAFSDLAPSVARALRSPSISPDELPST